MLQMIEKERLFERKSGVEDIAENDDNGLNKKKITYKGDCNVRKILTDDHKDEKDCSKNKCKSELELAEQNSSVDECVLRRRVCSENDVSIVGPMKRFSLLKSLLEDKIRSTSGKLCKECFFNSIESHLCTLGFISPCTGDADLIEEVEDNEENQEKAALMMCQQIGSGNEDDDSPNEGGLLKSLHRRTLSDIDWHELTRFAQGELFDPESSTAKEIKKVIDDGKDELSVAFRMMHNMDFDYVVEEAEKCVQCVINTGWRVVSHWELPHWLRDNDFLWHMHRPQLPSFRECFCSMFRIHTETGNIWTHFFGLILVVISMLFLYLRPAQSMSDFPKGWEEYLVFGAFFIGAIVCLMFSWLYHTCSCHSKKTSKLFSKLDYTGIACMIMGSFIPSMYYSFYCQFYEKLIYISSALTLGVLSIIVALWDKFATPGFRAVRAGLFLALGCSGIVPVVHMLFLYGLDRGVQQGQVGWLALMGICYIIGALLYALRIPERYFPGKCNLLFQSHQIFHVLVVVAAFVHLHGCCEMASYRARIGRHCSALPLDNTYTHSNITLNQII